MLTCERCGAGIPPNTDTCAYCGTLSEQARIILRADQARERQVARQQAAEQAVIRQRALSVTELAASRALTWGLLSFVFFCLPVFNVLSFLAFKRAQGSAREAGIPLPTRATVGLVCALVTGVPCVLGWVYMVTDMRANEARVQARKAELVTQIAAHPASADLDRTLSCALAEQYVLINGFANSTDTGSFRDFICAGSVTVLNERAEMPDFKFKVSSSAPQQTATVCFKHAALWFVESAGVNGCDLKGAGRAAAPRP